MISEHELVEFVRKLYPQTRALEEECLTLFNQAFQPGRGPLGVTGINELDWTIQYLESAASYLRRMGEDKGLIKPHILFFPNHPIVPRKDAWFSRLFKKFMPGPVFSPETQRQIDETLKKGEELLATSRNARASQTKKTQEP